MPLTAKQIGQMSADSTRTLAVSYAPPLRGDEILIGTPTAEQSAGFDALTITDVEINSNPVEVLGVMVPAFRAVTFKAQTTPASRGRYVLNVKVDSNGGQSFNDDYLLEVH